LRDLRDESRGRGRRRANHEGGRACRLRVADRLNEVDSGSLGAGALAAEACERGAVGPREPFGGARGDRSLVAQHREGVA
jgi:hypothetical protein